MPRLVHRSPRMCHEKNSGQAIVRVDGRKIYLGRWADPESKQNYDRVVAQWLSNGRRLHDCGGTPDLTINELALAYWQHAEQHYRRPDGTQTSELVCIKSALRPLKDLYGHTIARDFGPLALKAVRQAMIDAKLTRTSINLNVYRVRHMFRWAVANEMLPTTVYQALQTVEGLRCGRSAARESEPVKPVQERFVQAVLPHVSPQVAAMTQLQQLAGMRPGEIVVMRGCDLNTTGQAWLSTPASHKTEHHGHKRLIFLGPKAQEILKPWLRTDLQAYLFSPAEAEATRNEKRSQERKSPMTPSQAKRKPKKNPRRHKRDLYTVASYRRAIDVFLEANLMGSLRLFQAAHESEVPRFVFISTCAVHEVILGDRSSDKS